MRTSVGHGILMLSTSMAFAAGVASACGSSDSPSDGSADAGNDQGVITDTIPPSIVSRTPADGEGEVSVRAPIQVTFNKQVKLGSTAVSLLAGDVPVPVTTDLSLDRKTLTLTPSAPITAPTKVTVKLGDISSVPGVLLPETPWSWTAPRWLEVGGDTLPAAASDIAAGPGERVSAVVGTADGVQVRTIDRNNGTWTQLGQPVATALSQAGFWTPRLVIGEGGLPAVGFVDPNEFIRVRQWDGTAWNDLGDPIGKRDSIIDFWMAADPSGKIFVAYNPDTTGSLDVAVRTFDKGAWSHVGGDVFGDPSEAARVRSLAIDKSGVPYVAYTTNADDSRVRSQSAGGWKFVGSRLNSDGSSPWSMNLAFDDGGNVFALGTFGKSIRALAYDGQNWPMVGAELPPSGADQAAPLCLMRMKEGHLFALARWTEETLAFDVTKGGWSPIELPVLAAGRSYAVCTLDPGGAPVIGWQTGDGTQGTQMNVLRLNR